MEVKTINLGELIEKLQQIRDEHGADIDIWIRAGNAEHMLTGIRYAPETEKEEAGVILRGRW